MAEKSPRPGAEDDAEEEGEEAAEAPVRGVKVVVRKDKSAISVTPPPPGEAEEAPLPRSTPSLPSRGPVSPPASPPKPSPQRAVPEARAYPKVTPAHPAASPAFYTPPSGDAASKPEAAAYTSPAVSPSVSGVNLFANDGSFLELFKKKMEASSAGNNEEVAKEPEEKKPEPDKRKPISFVGKRRGGAKLALKTGIVAKKPKTDDEEILTHKGGAWAQYMAEVKKYKAHQCSDDDKTRPLVK